MRRSGEFRRHHAERVKNNRKRYHSNWNGKNTETPCKCSCWMCGNPRRHDGEVTIQELRGGK